MRDIDGGTWPAGAGDSSQISQVLRETHLTFLRNQCDIQGASWELLVEAGPGQLSLRLWKGSWGWPVVGGIIGAWLSPGLPSERISFAQTFPRPSVRVLGSWGGWVELKGRSGMEPLMPGGVGGVDAFGAWSPPPPHPPPAAGGRSQPSSGSGQGPALPGAGFPVFPVSTEACQGNLPLGCNSWHLVKHLLSAKDFINKVLLESSCAHVGAVVNQVCGLSGPLGCTPSL